MPGKNSRLVYLRGDGKWINKKDGSTKATSIHDSKEDAISTAKINLENQGGGTLRIVNGKEKSILKVKRRKNEHIPTSKIQSSGYEGFIHKYYDWAEFEIFIKSLYEDEGDVNIERNVIEFDRYNSKRETDVKITRKTRFHTYVTLVECKRWKEPVTRARVDILSSSIEALGANKGAIFTTTGYEEGAIAYAKGKGIDIFLIRDLTEREWGNPGRLVQIYLHTWTGEFNNLTMPGAMAIPLIEGDVSALNINIHLDQELSTDPNLNLYSIKSGKCGPNLISVLGDAHGIFLDEISKSFGLLSSGKDTSLKFFSKAELSFGDCEFCQLRLPEAAVKLKRILFDFTAQVNQSFLQIDRGKNLDFALVVENYITSQRLVAHRSMDNPKIRFHVANPSEIIHDDLYKNGSILRVFTSPWVGHGVDEPEKKAIVHQVLKLDFGMEGTTPKLSFRVATP